MNLIKFVTGGSVTYKPAAGKQPAVGDVVGWAVVLLRRRWPLLLAGAGVTAWLFLALPRKFATKSYEARASLLHTNLPIPESQKVFYQAPELKTVVALFNDRNTLNLLREREKLTVPVKLLEKSITAEVASGTRNIKLNLGWANDEDAVRMLGETIRIVGETLDEVRIGKLTNHVKELEAELEERAGWLKAASLQLDEYNGRNQITDLESDLDRIQNEITEKKIQLEAIERNGMDLKAQQDRLAQYMSEIKKREENDAEESRQFEAAAETVTDNRRRQDRIRELIYEERRVQEVKSRIAAKKGEYDRLEALRKKGFGSPQEMDAITGELKALEAQIESSQKIEDWEKELERIDKVVVPRNAKKNVGSPIIQQTLFRDLELTLARLANGVQARAVKESIAKKTAEKTRLTGLRVENDDLKRKLTIAQDAERAAGEKVQILKGLIRLRNAEIVVIAQPQIAPEATRSNRKIMMLAGLGAGAMPTFALVAVLEGIHLVRARRRRQLFASLPMIGHYDRGRFEAARSSSTPSTDARLLAMKIRKLKPGFGAVIALAGVDEQSRGLSSLAAELAISLARRDERVLILNTRGIDRRRFAETELRVRPRAENTGSRTHRPGIANGAGDTSGSTVSAVSRPPGGTRIDKSRSSAVDLGPDASQLLMFEGEAAQGDQELPGLSDYLGFLRATAEEIKMPGPDYGIDVIPPGRPRLHAESLATHRMRELMREIRREYSIVIVLTAGLADPVALHTMMEHVDATILVVNHDVPAPLAVETLDDLKSQGEEILGQIVFENAPAHRRP